MTAEVVGIISIAVAQAFVLAKLLIDGKTRARESHLLSVEKNVDNITARQDADIKRLREQLDKLTEKLESLHEEWRKCEIDKAELMTRLELLERFRNVAAADDPTGRTKAALPPPPAKPDPAAL